MPIERVAELVGGSFGLDLLLEEEGRPLGVRERRFSLGSLWWW